MSKTETTREIAQRLGVTTQAVNRWRRKAEKKYETDLGRQSEADARIIIFNPDEVTAIEEFANVPETLPAVSEPDDEIEIEILEPIQKTGKTSASLVRLTQPSAQAAVLTQFDSADAEEDKKSIEQQSLQAAVAINDTVISYARFKIKSVLHEIDVTTEAIKANAIAEIQQELGKPAAGE